MTDKKSLNFIDRALMYVAPRVGEARIRARIRSDIMLAKAGYDAAGNGRRWSRGYRSSQNAENKKALHHLRNIARELERNNPYIPSALQVIDSLTVGTGIRPIAKHPTSKRKAALANSLIRDWAESTDCDYDGQMNLYGLMGLAIRTQSLGGEVLALKHISSNRKLAIPLQMQLHEGDLIDDTRDAIDAGSSNLVQGIEIVGGKRRTYHLFERHPGDTGYTSVKSNPVSADNVAHVYEILRPGQVRGIPRGVAAYTRLKGLDDFQDARIEQQRMAACLVGAVYSEGGYGSDVTGDPLPDKLEPGIFPRLTGDERVIFNTPPSVSGQDSFVRGEQFIVAACWGITYESMTGDYSNVNFASGKMGRMQMFSNVDRWRRRMLIPQFCHKVGGWFFEVAALKGHDLSGVYLDWTPPKKEILDIKNELPAIIQEVRAGMNSLQGALRERGTDLETVAYELSDDFKLLDELQLVLDIDPRKVTRAGQLQSVSTGNTAPTTEEEPGDAEEEENS